MKKLNLVKTFLKVGRILGIVCVALFAVLLCVFTIIDIVAIVTVAADEGDVAAAIGVLVVAIIEYTIFIAASIASLILNGIATRKINAATSKAEVKKPAILAIISGALFATFGIPAGIIALCMNEKDWEEINAAKVVDVKTTEAKATETEVK